MNNTIMVIDDDKGILESIKIILQEEGYEVMSYEEAPPLSELKRIKPQLIILDVYLQGQDGREVAKKIKGNSETHHIPIIMISAISEVEQSVVQSGANEFLTKPFDLYTLVHHVHKNIQVTNVF